METNGNNLTIWDDLSDVQIQAVSFKLLNPHATNKDIANEIGIPKGTVDKWRVKSIVKEIRKDSAKAANDYANRLLVKAFRILEKQMDSSDERVAQSAIKEVIDRAIGKATQNNTLSNPDGSNLLEGLIININDKPED